PLELRSASCSPLGFLSRVLPDQGLGPAVFSPAVLVGFAAIGLFLAVRDRRYVLGRNPEADIIIAHGLSALLAQGEVVSDRASLVAITRSQHVEILVGLQIFR